MCVLKCSKPPNERLVQLSIEDRIIRKREEEEEEEELDSIGDKDCWMFKEGSDCNEGSSLLVWGYFMSARGNNKME